MSVERHLGIHSVNSLLSGQIIIRKSMRIVDYRRNIGNNEWLIDFESTPKTGGFHPQDNLEQIGGNRCCLVELRGKSCIDYTNFDAKAQLQSKLKLSNIRILIRYY